MVLRSSIGGLASRRHALHFTRNLFQRRLVQTQKIAPETSEALVKQRLVRPTSPHLSIYKPQITWYLSSLNRITGVALSGGLYLFAISYLVAPLMGWHLESQSLAAAFATWPAVAKIGTKILLAGPFFFHGLNGIRHLSWDLGIGFAKKTVIQTGFTVVGLTSLLTAYYSFF